MCQLKAILTSHEVMAMAAKILHFQDPKKKAIDNMVEGIHCSNQDTCKVQTDIIDVPQNRKDGERIIGLFFDPSHYYKPKYNVRLVQI